MVVVSYERVYISCESTTLPLVGLLGTSIFFLMENAASSTGVCSCSIFKVVVLLVALK